MQRLLFEHLNLTGHSGFSKDVSVTLIHKTDPKNPTKREDYWIHILKTKAPLLKCGLFGCFCWMDCIWIMIFGHDLLVAIVSIVVSAAAFVVVFIFVLMVFLGIIYLRLFGSSFSYVRNIWRPFLISLSKCLQL